MTKRHPSPPPVSQTGAGRNRRLTPRRSVQDNVRAAAGWVLERTLASLAPVDSFLDSVSGPLRRARPGAAHRAGDGKPALAAAARSRHRRGEQPEVRADRAGPPCAAAHRRLPAALPRPRAAARRRPRGGRAGEPAHPSRRRELRQRRSAGHRPRPASRRVAGRSGRSGAEAGDRDEPSRFPRRALARPLRPRAHSRSPRRQQQRQAAPAPRLPRPRRPRAFGGRADRRRPGGRAGGPVAARSDRAPRQLPGHGGLCGRPLLRPGRGEPGGGADPASPRRRADSDAAAAPGGKASPCSPPNPRSSSRWPTCRPPA